MGGLINIDNVSYSNLVLEGQEFRIHIRMEDGINNFISSEAKVTLANNSALENIFLSNSPYLIYNAGYVEIQEAADFGLFPLFRGYIDKQSAPVNLTEKTIELSIIGLEKNISDRLSNFDITKVYYPEGSGSDRQRGGRVGAFRMNWEIHNPIEDYVINIFEDLGYSYVVHIPNSSFFKWKYNQDQYGDFNNQRSIAIVRNITDRGRVPGLDSDLFKMPSEESKDSASYNFLLKEFAKLTGCIYFYDHASNKMCFFPRDYNFNTDLSRQTLIIDDLIIDNNPNRIYGYSYNAIAVEFEDITLVIKKTTSGLLPGFVFEYGVSLPEGTQTDNDFVQAGDGSDYIAVGDGSVQDPNETNFLKLYRMGGVLTKDLFANNALRINIAGSIGDYLQHDNDLIGGDSIKDFLDAIYENYEFVISKSKTEDLLSIGSYTLPVRVRYEGQEYNVFEGEIDLHRGETRIRFDR